GKITELKATKASQLTATFDSAVPADTKIEVAKGSSAIEGKSTIDGSTVVFDATANLTAGTYTLTATLGDVKESAETEVKDSYVAEIKITSKEALTAEGPATTTSGSAISTEKLAYIYYDVLNQYGESIKNSTTINWTTSVGNDTKKVDKSLGKITVSNGTTSFTYGSLIYVTGVHVGSGTTVSASIPVGMAQAVNTIEFAGFINKNASTKLVDSLPINFPKNTYVLAYRTFDQNGNPLTVKGTEIADGDLTFINDNVLLVDSSITDAGTYTIDGVEYAAVTIEPGDYVGKGGEVNITAIANKTGQKTVKNFTVGAAGLLQSLTLSTPANVVADGDQWVKFPYVAKDADGKSITNYETIVRSTNTLTLTATDGDLYVIEENDGTAGIYWCDDASKATAFNSASADNVDRSVSLGSIVVGGESNIMVLPVSDARRPVAFKSIKLNGDDNNAIVSQNTANIDLYSGNVVYLDQYGADLKGDNAIVKAYMQSNTNGIEHGVKVKTDGNKAIVGLNDKVYTGADDDKVIAVSADSATVKNTTVKFSIVTAPTANQSNYNAWDNVDNEKSISYTVVPIGSLTNESISNITKQEIQTDNSDKANGTAKQADIDAGNPVAGATVVAGAIDANGTQSNVFSVTGQYDGKTLTIPESYYATTSGSAFTIASGSALAAIDSSELSWNELYDENTARFTRKDVTKKLVLLLNDGSENGVKLSKNVTLSDAASVASDIRYFVDWWQYNPAEVTLLPENTVISSTGDHTYKPSSASLTFGEWTNFQIHIYDQYGKMMERDNGDGSKAEYTVTDIKESTSDLTHVPSSFKVTGSGSGYSQLQITGAEVGDSFTLTATIPGTSISKSIKINVGADTQAYVSNDNDADKTFRTAKLGYKK
ncbi:hypothetical protein D7V86_25570, partial [bacterium D16-51]